MSLIEDERLPVPGAQDAPSAVVSNSQPASIDVQSNLAEDTVIGGVMDIATGLNQVAMFANPFANGSEEMLYVDEQRTLRWARHVNPTGTGPLPPQSSGWSIEPLVTNVVEVVIAVHPRGSVFAFVLVGAPGDCHLTSYELVADPAVPEGYRWSGGSVWLPNMNLAGLSVYYASDRPTTPFVFVTDPKEPRLLWYSPAFPAPGSDGLQWHPGGEFAYDAADRGVRVLAGVDSPVQLGNPVPMVDCVRLWSVVGGTLNLTTYWPAQQSYERFVVGSAQWTSLVGTWSHPHSAGVVGILGGDADAGTRVGLALPFQNQANAIEATLDRPLDDLVVWQDAASMLHLYGRDSDATLTAVHQVDWQTSFNGLTNPVWDQHVDQLGSSVVTTRPLVGQVATFAVDAYPDDLPSQHVMHQGVAPGETCAIYTQSVRTSFWCREQVRLVPETLPKPYLVPRYETSLTVKDGHGNAMVGLPVSLSADAPVDLEVAGAFYRTGSVTPVTLVTDLRGQVTLRVVASGLSVPQLYVTAPGLAQSVTVQMAADVHRFLAGNGTLPNHGDGFTETAVLDATNPDGTPLFPDINRGDAAATWPPSAADVVTWCQAVFALDAGAPLPAAMSDGLDAGQRVHAFTLQTHDPGRRGFEVFTGPDQLDARAAAIAAKGGFLGEADDWVGDVWLGIRQGVTLVAEVLVEVEDRIIELVVELADGVLARLRAAWDDIVSAAHAVEAVFVAIGAKLQEAIDWLRWAFDFGDALLTTKALAGALAEAPRLVKFALDSMEDFTADFFANLEAQVDTLFETAKERFAGRTFSALQGPFGTVPSEAQPPATVTSANDHATGPHASWMTEKVMGPGAEGALRTEGTEVVGDILDKFVDILAGAGELTSLVAVTEDMGRLFYNLFSGKDAESVLTSEIITVLDVLKDIVTTLLTFLDQVVNGVLEWGKVAVDEFLTMLATPLDGSPLISLLWDFVLEQAGVDPIDYPLTLGMFGMFFVAYPFTVVWKVVAGAPPFPSGRIPMPALPPVLGNPAEPRTNPSPDLLRFQAFQGFVQTFDLILDALVNAEAKVKGDAKASEVPPPWEVPALVVQGFAAAHAVAYIIGDFPWFWGYPWPGGSAQRNLPYARYGLTFIFNFVDLITAFSEGALAQQFAPKKTDPRYEEKVHAYVAETTACGMIRMTLQFWESFTKPDSNWYDWWNLAINQTSYMQTAFGFVRYVYEKFPTTPAAVVLAVETVFAVLGDLFSGICTVVQPARELGHPPAIVTADGPRQTYVFPPAVVGTAYTCPDLEVKGGWPGFTWTSAGDPGNPDFDDPDAGLPDGLGLAEGRVYDGWRNRFATVKGTPTSTHDWTRFDLSVQDNYGPALMASLPCFVRVIATTPPADAPPVASFTVISPTGPSSTWQLIDTSTGGAATSWSWEEVRLGIFGTDPIAGFADPGIHEFFNVDLTVTNAYGSSTATQRIETGVPITDFTAWPPSGAAPLTVQFTDTSRNAPYGWLWDFGDGQTSPQPNPSHTYASAGIYTVTLWANNDWGPGQPYSQQVIAYELPQARFTATPTSGRKPLKVQFTDTSTNMPTSWYWEFGDQNQSRSTDQNPAFTYYQAGTYTVLLTVTNPAGHTAVETTITVTAT